MIEINLNPGASRKTKGRGAGFSLAGAMGGDRPSLVKDPFLLAAIVSLLVAGGTVGTMHMTQSQTSAELAQREEQAVADSTRFATVLAGPSAAADLVASAVAKASANPDWRTVDNRRAYLYRAVLNEARQTARSDSRRQRREQLAAPVERTGGEPSVRPEVLAAVRRLDQRQRAIVFFTYWQDRTPAEIADDLGVTVRTVQRELADARARLLEHLR